MVLEIQEPAVFDTKVIALQLALRMSAADTDGLFGKRTKSAVEIFQKQYGLKQDGRVGSETGRALGLPFWDAATKRTLDVPFRDPTFFGKDHIFDFSSTVNQGYYSFKPESYIGGEPITRRALRTNNPGALNISSWQKRMPGYIGRTLPDNSSNKNKTTIYLRPQDGVAAWYYLLVVRYERAFELISGGTGYSINIKRLAKAYGLGKPNTADEQLSSKELKFLKTYMRGWPEWSRKVGLFELKETSEVDHNDVDQMTSLALSMFSHEAGFHFPLSLDEIREGVHLGMQHAQLTARSILSSASKRNPSEDFIYELEFDIDAFEEEVLESEARLEEFSNNEQRGLEDIVEFHDFEIEKGNQEDHNTEHAFLHEDGGGACEAPQFDEVRELALFHKSIRGIDVDTFLDHDSEAGIYGYYPDKYKYGISDVIDALYEVGSIWFERHQKDEIGIGDISQKGGGWIPGHSSHRKGVDVDLRMLRKDRERQHTQWHYDTYDRDATQELIDLLWTNSKIRTKFILFNDPQSIGTQWYKNHDNHLHVRFQSTYGVWPIRTMQTGARKRPEVREIQRRLNYWGKLDANLVIDGDFGVNTDLAVKAFQEDMNLEVDGKVGQNSWKVFGDFRSK